MFPKSLTALTLCLSVACVVAGCSKDNDPWNRAAVEGEVTLDGEPLSTGVIAFYPVQGTEGPAAGGKIVDGRYSLEANEGPVSGWNRVEIRSVQKTGRMVESTEVPMADGAPQVGQMVEEFANVVPPRYNSRSVLKHEITPETVNRIDFPLTSVDETSPTD